MITWRGWGLLVIPIGFVPLIYAAALAVGNQPAEGSAASASITGHVAWALVISALLNYALSRMLLRTRGPRQDEFMGVTLKTWTAVFLAIAVIVAIVWAVQRSA
jgi:hypothetical protein